MVRFSTHPGTPMFSLRLLVCGYWQATTGQGEGTTADDGALHAENVSVMVKGGFFEFWS